MQKILLILATVLSLISIGLGYVNRTNLVTAKGGKLSVETERDNLKSTLAAKAAEIKGLQDKVATTTQDAQKSSSDLADLHSRIDKSTADLAALQTQLTQKDADLAQQKTDLSAKDARIAELEAKTATATQPVAQSDDLKKQLEEKNILATSLQEKNKEIEAQLADLRDREAHRKAKVMQTGLAGKILAVNPSWNFVVLSLGDRNGVVANSELLINRGGELIGKVRVTSVEPSTSIADIVVNSVRPGMSVQPGDTVIYSGPDSDAVVKQ